LSLPFAASLSSPLTQAALLIAVTVLPWLGGVWFLVDAVRSYRRSRHQHASLDDVLGAAAAQASPYRGGGQAAAGGVVEGDGVIEAGDDQPGPLGEAACVGVLIDLASTRSHKGNETSTSLGRVQRLGALSVRTRAGHRVRIVPTDRSRVVPQTQAYAWSSLAASRAAVPAAVLRAHHELGGQALPHRGWLAYGTIAVGDPVTFRGAHALGDGGMPTVRDGGGDGDGDGEGEPLLLFLGDRASFDTAARAALREGIATALFFFAFGCLLPLGLWLSS
jgi:hypothetical protein